MKYPSSSILLLLVLVCVFQELQKPTVRVFTTKCNSLVKTQGYPCEEHQVTTEDGYILRLQRIPHGQSGDNSLTNQKVPVLLQHGILAAYWEWIWEQLAAYELPALFNYVQQQTGQKSHYVGHSLGTLTVLAALSEHKLINSLRSAALLSPIAYLGHISTVMVRVATQVFLAEDFYHFGFREFPPPLGPLEQALQTTLCVHLGVNCSDMLAAITGPNICSSSGLRFYREHALQSTSKKNFLHMSQMIRTGTMREFDYSNPLTNLQHYRKFTPPQYNMANIPKNIPLFFGCGGEDAISDVNDVKALLNDHKNHDKDKLVEQYVEEYAHLDFMMCWDAKQKVYDPMLTFFGQH